MRHAIGDLPQRLRRRWRQRLRHERRPVVEGLEERALLSAAHDLTVHDHIHAQRAKRTVSGYQQTNLVSDIRGMAQFTDSSLKNPWGMAFSPTTATRPGSPFWISNQMTGTATIDSVDQSNTVTQGSLKTVTIPTAGSSSPNGPTGQVFNSTGSTTDFLLPPSGSTPAPAAFIFDTLQGTIEGWSPNSTGGLSKAVIKVNNSSTAEYTGLALGSSGGKNLLYAANDLTSPGIEVYDGTFTRVTLTGNFVDPKLPKGDVPYNIQNINGELFVTYRGSNFKGGAVAEFNTDGTFVKQIAANKSTGNLQAPWGVALAPANFGKFSNDLLVGNFGNGRINAFNAKGRFSGQLATTARKPIAISGLWSIAFGNGGRAGSPRDLYFTAGINGQADGLFGALQAITK
jgi:uncharacterized protein (TIGR03118 family)